MMSVQVKLEPIDLDLEELYVKPEPSQNKDRPDTTAAPTTPQVMSVLILTWCEKFSI